MLLELRDAAKLESDHLRRFTLQKIANLLDIAIAKFAREPTTERLIEISGLWARAYRMLHLIGSAPPHNGAGLREGAKLTDVA